MAEESRDKAGNTVRESQTGREAIINKVQEQQPDDEILYDLAELFKVFGDSTRIKILYSMFEHELCVNDIAEIGRASGGERV